MSIAFIQAAHGHNTTGSCAATFGSTPTNGNLMLAWVFTIQTAAPAAAAGWTRLPTTAATATNSRAAAMYYRIAGASEPTAQTVTGSGGSNWICQILEYSGTDTSVSFFDGQDVALQASGATFTTGTISPTAGQELEVVTCYGLRQTSTSFSAEQVNSSGTGVNERVDSDFAAMADLNVASTSGTYSGTATPSTSTVTGVVGIIGLKVFVPAPTGTIAGTLAQLTADVEAVETLSGTVAGTLAQLTASVAATETIAGTADGILTQLTADVEAVETLDGTVDGTLAQLTALLYDDVPPISGTVDGTLPNLTADVAAAETIDGAVDGILPDLTAEVTATQTIDGLVQGSLPQVEASVSAALAIDGSIAGTLFPLRARLFDTYATRKLATLRDDFALPYLDPYFWKQADPFLTFPAYANAGDLVCEVPYIPTFLFQSGVTTANAPIGAWDFGASTVTIDVSHFDPMLVTDESGTYSLTSASFWVGHNAVGAADQWFVTLERGTADSGLVLRLRVDTSTPSFAEATPWSAAWDPVAMRYWRYREHAGTIYFETSPNSLAWTTQHSDTVPSPWSLNNSFTTLRLDRFGGGPTDDAQFRVASINITARRPHSVVFFFG